MAHFDVQGPFWLPIQESGWKIGGAPARRAFWVAEPVATYAKRRGVYLFALEWGHRFIPYFVGRTGRKTFTTACLTQHMAEKYTEAIRVQRGGKPALFLLVAREEETDSAAVRAVEDFLVDLAYRKNPQFQDFQGPGHGWGIEGMIRGKAPGWQNSAARILADSLGLD